MGDGSSEGQVELSGTDEGYEGGGESTPSNVSRSKESCESPFFLAFRFYRFLVLEYRRKSSPRDLIILPLVLCPSAPSASDNSPPPPVDTSLSLLLAAPSFSSSSASPRLSASGPSSSTRPYSMQEVQNLRDGYLYMEDEHEKQGKEMARLRVEARRNEDRLQQKVDHYKALWDTEVEKSLDCKGKLEAKERELAEIEKDFFIVRKEPGVTVTVVYEPFHSF